MDKATEIGQTSVTGSYYLFVGNALSTVMLAVGTIILQALILESDYGLYAIALIPSTTFLLFQDLGVNTALTRQVAQFRAANRETDLRKVITAGLTFEVATATILAIVSTFSASFVASSIFNKPESTNLIVFASITIFSIAIFKATQNILIGFGRTKLISVALVCQAITQSVISPFLVFIGFGAFGALIGYTLGSILAGIVAIALLYFSIFRNLEKVNIRWSDLTETLKPMLMYGIPLAIGSILMGVLTQFCFTLMAFYVSDLSLIGNFRVASNFTVLLTLLINPVAAMLLPAFSRVNPRKEIELIRSLFSSSVKYFSLLLVPSTLTMMVLSRDLIGTLYGAKWSSAASFLALGTSFSLLVLFGSIVLSTFFAALGETKFIMKMSLVNIVIGLPLGLTLIPAFGVNGGILAYSLAPVPSLFIGLHLASKKYGAKPDLSSSARILSVSTLAAIAVFLFLYFFAAAYWLNLVLGLVIFAAIYLTCAPLMGAVNLTDIENLRTMFKGLGFVSKLLKGPLTIMEKILRTTLNHKRPKRTKIATVPAERALNQAGLFVDSSLEP